MEMTQGGERRAAPGQRRGERLRHRPAAGGRRGLRAAGPGPRGGRDDGRCLAGHDGVALPGRRRGHAGRARRAGRPGGRRGPGPVGRAAPVPDQGRLGHRVLRHRGARGRSSERPGRRAAEADADVERGGRGRGPDDRGGAGPAAGSGRAGGTEPASLAPFPTTPKWWPAACCATTSIRRPGASCRWASRCPCRSTRRPSGDPRPPRHRCGAGSSARDDAAGDENGGRGEDRLGAGCRAAAGGGPGRCGRGRRPGLRLGGRDDQRSLPVVDAGRRALDPGGAGDRRGHRLRPQPDEPGLHDEPAAGVLGRARRARVGVAGAAPHRAALLHDLVEAGGPHARVRAGAAGHLGLVERRWPGRLRGRVLHPHADDAGLRATAARLRGAPGLPGRRGPAA